MQRSEYKTKHKNQENKYPIKLHCWTYIIQSQWQYSEINN